MDQNHFDIAVIGLGALGSSALWHLSRSGKRIVGFDQFAPPHTMGSTHGESRITRIAVGEGMDFVPLAKRSHELWREIEKESGQNILTVTGGLLFDSGGKGWSKHGSEGFFQRTVKFAEQAGVPFELWEVTKLMQKFPEFNLEENGSVYYEPGAGFLRPELAVSAQLSLAEKNGAVLKTKTKILQIQPLPQGGIRIKSNQGDVESGKLLLSAGAWVKDFLPDFAKSNFKICRQVMHYIPKRRGFYELGKTPVFMWGFGPDAEDFLYGFPSLDGNFIKVASESFLEIDHPDTVSRIITAQEQQDFLMEKISGRLCHLENKVEKSQVCMYTVTPNANFVVDELPDFPEVLLASACSGHGFKHSAALGEAIADHLLDKKTKVNLKPFRWF